MESSVLEPFYRATSNVTLIWRKKKTTKNNNNNKIKQQQLFSVP
jgi:hypothetical protein